MNKIKNYINLKYLIILFLILILFYLSSLFKLIPILLLKVNQNNPTNKILLTLFSNICLLFILVLIYKKELIEDFKIFKKDFLKNINTATTYWIVGIFIMLSTNLLINILFKPGGSYNEKVVQQMINTSPIVMLITAGIIAPIIEELVFRKSFKKAFPNKYLFIIISSFIFGLLHVINSSTLLGFLYIIPYMSLGMAFALAYNKTNTIFSSIFIHILHNSVLIILSII